MKITDIKTAVVRYHGHCTLVRIDTDEGISGYGEANPDAGARSVVGMIEQLKPRLLGEDPRNVERIWDKLRRGYIFGGAQGGVTVIALSGIELALWDLAAKAAGQPLYRMMGGKFRDRIRLYADCHAGDDESPASYAARARELVEEGFSAVKFDIDDLSHPAKYDRFNHTLNNAEITTMVERVAAVREAVGPDLDLCIDMHGRYDTPSACRVAWEMEPFKLMWLEEPVPAENIDALAKVRASSHTPICVGENLYLRWGFKELLEKQAADIIMPDVPKCGGLAESKKIANYAEVYYVPFAPHLVSTPLGTMATCQMLATIPNFLVLEWHAYYEQEYWNSYVKLPEGERSIVKNGHIEIPDTPGIGVELDMDGVRKYAVPGFGIFE